jgi:hypothetical protein
MRRRNRVGSALLMAGGVTVMISAALVPAVEAFLNFWVTLIVLGGGGVAALLWGVHQVWDSYMLNREIAETNRVNTAAGLARRPPVSADAETLPPVTLVESERPVQETAR